MDAERGPREGEGKGGIEGREKGIHRQMTDLGLSQAHGRPGADTTERGSTFFHLLPEQF